MLVVIFSDDTKAYDAADSLQTFHEDGIVAVKGAWVLTRQADGAVAVVKTDDTLPEGTMGATVVGSLIGLFGGPVGLAVGAASGLLVGATADIARARLDQDFVADITNNLAPGKAALVAEIDEEEPEAVDERMNALGGLTFRRDLSDIADAEYEQRAGAVKSRVASVNADLAQAYAERKGRLQARMNTLFQRRDKQDAQE